MTNTVKTQTKFPWRLWWWTEADQSLFDLTPEELYMFKLFVAEATR